MPPICVCESISEQLNTTMCSHKITPICYVYCICINKYTHTHIHITIYIYGHMTHSTLVSIKMRFCIYMYIIRRGWLTTTKYRGCAVFFSRLCSLYAISSNIIFAGAMIIGMDKVAYHRMMFRYDVQTTRALCIYYSSRILGLKWTYTIGNSETERSKVHILCE